MTRAPALLLAALALTALSACNSDPSTVNAPPTTPPVTTTSGAPSTATATTSASPTSNCPPGKQPAGGIAVVSATVAGGKVSTPRETWEVDVNTPVRVAVTTDVREEVHVHTYDVKQVTVPGCPTTLDFVANIPGTHEVELEGKHLLLFRIKVG